VFENVILEIKAKEGGIAEEDLAQSLNYLKCSGMQGCADTKFCEVET